MSRRKFRAPRHGSKGFLPHKRTKRKRPQIKFHGKAVPAGSPEGTIPVHIDSFLAYKAGCTHVIREIVKPNSPLHQRESSEAVTILESAPMVCVGFVIYKETPSGLKTLFTYHIKNLSEGYKRAASPKIAKHANIPLAFSRKENEGLNKTQSENLKKIDGKVVFEKKQDKKEYYQNIIETEEDIEKVLEQLPEFEIMRVILHSVPPEPLDRKRSHTIESQVLGGADNKERFTFVKSLLGKPVPVSSAFAQNESIDIIGITKGKGFQGVVKRFGVKVLHRKARKGRRRVGCIGPWHPSNVSYAVARAGQMGHFHRTELNKQIFIVGKAENEAQEGNASTSYDPTRKNITPLGGFKGYGEVKNDFLMIKGSVAGPTKGAVCLRKSINFPYKRELTEEVRIKFIDTASKIGKGRFQTNKEKNQYFGIEEKA